MDVRINNTNVQHQQLNQNSENNKKNSSLSNIIINNNDSDNERSIDNNVSVVSVNSPSSLNKSVSKTKQLILSELQDHQDILTDFKQKGYGNYRVLDDGRVGVVITNFSDLPFIKKLFANSKPQSYYIDLRPAADQELNKLIEFVKDYGDRVLYANLRELHHKVNDSVNEFLIYTPNLYQLTIESNYLTKLKANLPDLDDLDLHYCRKLKKLTLPSTKQVSSFDLGNCHELKQLNLPELIEVEKLSLTKCRNLETLSLPKLEKAKNLVLSSCYTLQSIDLPNLIELKYIELNHCENLQSLSLSKIKKLKDLSSVGCENLCKISIPNLEKIKGMITLWGCKKLTELDLSNLKSAETVILSDCALIHELKLPKLESIDKRLNLENCINLQTFSLPKLNKLHYLKLAYYPGFDLSNFSILNVADQLDLDLKNCSNFSFPEINNLKELEVESSKDSPLSLDLKKLSNLKRLDCREAKELLLPENSSLETLSIRYSDELDNLNLSQQSYLKKLKISYCKKLDVLDLASMNLLEELDLYECSGLIDFTVPHLPHLKKVDLSQCKNLRSVDLRNTKNVKKLKLSFMDNLETADFSTLKDLVELKLTYCKKLENLNLSSQKLLKDLDLSGSENIRAIRFFKEHHLEKLDICGCRSLELDLVILELMYHYNVQTPQDLNRKINRLHYSYHELNKTFVEKAIEFVDRHKLNEEQFNKVSHFLIHYKNIVEKPTSNQELMELEDIFNLGFPGQSKAISLLIQELQSYHDSYYKYLFADQLINEYYLSENIEINTQLISKITELQLNKPRPITSMILFSLVRSLEESESEQEKIYRKLVSRIFYKSKVCKDKVWIKVINNGLFNLMSNNSIPNNKKKKLLETATKLPKNENSSSRKHNLERKMALLSTFISLGLVTKHDDLSSIAEAEMILKNHFIDSFNLKEIDDFHDKYQRSIGTFRNENALFTYLASLNRLVEGEVKDRILDNFRTYTESVIEGTFKEMRYNVNENSHLREIEPQILEKWKKGEFFIVFGSKQRDEVQGNQHQIDTFNELFQDKILGHNHLGDGWAEKYPYFAEAFVNGSIHLPSLVEELNQAIKIEKDPQQEKDLEVQKHILTLCMMNHNEVTEEVRNLLQELRDLLDDDIELKNDIQQFLNQQNLGDIDAKLTVIDSDNPEDLLMCGTDIQGSCQRINGNAEFNSGLLGYLINGQTRLVAVKGPSGKILGRCLLRILLDKDNNPHLYREYYYGDKRVEHLVFKMCEKRAKALNLKLSFGRNIPDGGLHSKGGRAYCEYVDANRLRVTFEGKYSIY